MKFSLDTEIFCIVATSPRDASVDIEVGYNKCQILKFTQLKKCRNKKKEIKHNTMKKAVC